MSRRLRLEGLLTQWSETCAQLFHQELWLFPGGKVPPCIELVVVDELGIRPFGPTARRCIDLVRKHAHSDRDGDAFRCEER
jgi:hypothetical protein